MGDLGKRYAYRNVPMSVVLGGSRKAMSLLLGDLGNQAAYRNVADALDVWEMMESHLLIVMRLIGGKSWQAVCLS